MEHDTRATSASSSGPERRAHRIVPALHTRCRSADRHRNLRLALCAGLLSGLALPSVRAVEINYAYDDLNRLVSATRSDGPALAFQYDEAGNFTSQGVSNSPDTDGDLIANFADPDDDGDGMPDAWEAQYGFNPLDPADAAQDTDGDGITNLAEYQGNTDPLQNQQNSGTAHASVPAVPAEGLLLMAVALWRIAARLNQKNRGL